MILLLIATIAKIAFILAVAVGAFAPILIWAERRQSAMMQDRVGPVRANLPLFGHNITLGGLLHPLADAMKLIFKEDFVPPKADRLLFQLAPIISLVPVIAIFAVIPFADTVYYGSLGQYLGDLGDGRLCVLDMAATLQQGGGVVCSSQALGTAVPMQIAPLNVGILFVFAIAGTGVIGAAVGGYASDNKFSLLGGLRAAGQMVSYEVVLGLTLVGCFMVYNTLRLEEMVHWQATHVWGFIVQPVAFVLYLFAAIAETKRIPFDVPEGESELVGGYLTEYSGMKFGMFFMGEFIEVVALGALAVTLFFGGWQLPFLHPWGFEAFGQVFYLPQWSVLVIEIVTFIVKLVVLMWLQLQIRWTLPRFRYDQIMNLCWKYLLPLSLLNILVTGIVILVW